VEKKLTCPRGAEAFMLQIYVKTGGRRGDWRLARFALKEVQGAREGKETLFGKTKPSEQERLA
jgi:hypothetical protein